MNAPAVSVQESFGTSASDRWQIVKCGLLLLFALLTVRATFIAGQRLGMDTILSTRHVYYSLPYAISH
jgi:hypothetical protein